MILNIYCSKNLDIELKNGNADSFNVLIKNLYPLILIFFKNIEN